MTLSWFKNYLQDHNFHAVVEDMISQEKTINYSVSQGSLLGPVLFNCYHSTLHEEIPKHYSSMAMLMITLCKYHLNLVWFKSWSQNSCWKTLCFKLKNGCMLIG